MVSSVDHGTPLAADWPIGPFGDIDLLAAPVRDAVIPDLWDGGPAGGRRESAHERTGSA